MAPAATVLRLAGFHPSSAGGRRLHGRTDRVSLALPASSPPSVSWQQGSGAAIVRGCVRASAAGGSFERDRAGEEAVSPSPQGVEESTVGFLKVLKSANSIIPMFSHQWQQHIPLLRVSVLSGAG